MNILSRRSLPLLAAVAALPALSASAQTAPAAKPAEAPYKILHITQVPNTGSTDYIFADSADRRVYIPSGSTIDVFDLDTYKLVGTVPNAAGHGVVVDPESHHGFCSGNPSVMFDTQTLAQIKTNPAPGADGILFDPFTHHVFIQSHRAPNLLVIDSKDGSIVGTVEHLGKNDTVAATEQGVSDGNGTLYFDCEDQGCIAVVDAKTLKVTGEYDLGDKGGGDAGLAIDTKNHILFAMCRGEAGGQPTCVILSAKDGKIITTLPLVGGSDGGGFNPNTMEAFASQGNGNGTLTVIKENSPTDFVVEQNVETKPGAKCCTLDTKENHFLVFTTEAITTPAPAPAATSAAPAAASASASAAPAAASDSAGRRGGTGRAGRGGRGGRGGPSNLDLIIIGRDSAAKS